MSDEELIQGYAEEFNLPVDLARKVLESDDDGMGRPLLEKALESRLVVRSRMEKMERTRRRIRATV